jgi:outer membrane protein OmpA-like peptidoglycan-associated protein
MMRRLLLTAPLLLALGACANMDGLFGPPPARTFPLFFSEDSALLGDNARGIVAMAVDAAKANPQAKVTVRGFASPDTGTVAFNRALSEARARAVAEALVVGGIPSSRIGIEPRGAVAGAMFPTEARRVEIHIGG